VGVVIGFILSFTFFTLFLSTIVRISGIPAETMRFVSIFVIAGFGISLLIPRFQVLVERLFSKLARFMPSSQGRAGFGGGLLIGISVGLLWTPCVGPILASVISLAITGTVTFDAFLITFAYSLGTAIPMFLIMLGGQNALRRVPWLLANLGNIQKVFGVLMILTAIGIFFNIDRKFQTFVLTTFPQYGVGLTKFEDNEIIKNQLNKKNSGETRQDEMKNPASDLLDSQDPIAPELIPGGAWYNSEPLKLADLRGKVVLIDFWTYSCINCQRTLPYLREWNEKYQDKGLVIIGVHSPEFEFEKKESNVAQAIKDFKLTYPVVQDNDFATWRAYENRYWPAKYFIDKNGVIRRTHFGEGAYDESERMIQELLKEAGATDVSAEISNPVYQTSSQMPEAYLGSKRMEYYFPGRVLNNGKQSFTLAENVSKKSFSLGGEWNITDEYAVSGKNASINYNFTASKVFLVLRPSGDGFCSSGKLCTSSGQVRVLLDGKIVDINNVGSDVTNGIVTVDKDKLYNLIDLKDSVENHILKLEFITPGTEAYAFTFG